MAGSSGAATETCQWCAQLATPGLRARHGPWRRREWRASCVAPATSLAATSGTRNEGTPRSRGTRSGDAARHPARFGRWGDGAGWASEGEQTTARADCAQRTRTRNRLASTTSWALRPGERSDGAPRSDPTGTSALPKSVLCFRAFAAQGVANGRTRETPGVRRNLGFELLDSAANQELGACSASAAHA